MRWLCSCASGMHLVQVHRLCDHMGTVCVLGCLGVMLSCLIICQNTFRHTRTDVHPHTQSPQGYKQTSNRYIDRERERERSQDATTLSTFDTAGSHRTEDGCRSARRMTRRRLGRGGERAVGFAPLVPLWETERADGGGARLVTRDTTCIRSYGLVSATSTHYSHYRPFFDNTVF